MFEITVTGVGHPVVFIPGFARSGRVWEPIVGRLQGVEAHVISFPGFAGVPPVREPSLARIHAELERYILDSGLAEAIVVGHSLGGHMALWLAETLPSLGGVVDVEGFPFLAGVDDPTMPQPRAESAVRSKVAKFQAMTQGGDRDLRSHASPRHHLKLTREAGLLRPPDFRLRHGPSERLSHPHRRGQPEPSASAWMTCRRIPGAPHQPGQSAEQQAWQRARPLMPEARQTLRAIDAAVDLGGLFATSRSACPH